MLGALGRLAVVVLALSCSAPEPRFPVRAPVLEDPDRQAFFQEPEEYYSPFGWDAANQTVFRPMARFFAVDPAAAATNVNALDEVPNSSWFEARIGAAGLTPAQVAQGPCRTAPPNPDGPWTVIGAKPNGANPGFIIEAEDDRRYLLKFDGVVEGPRPTAADVIGSRLYHAAGYYVPCNRIVNFQRGQLLIDPEAQAEDDEGNDVPLRAHHLDQVFEKALRLKDGRYRANASLFIEGKPIGPWTYEGTLDDDSNDVVSHEDRRELRGSAVFAAWTNHFDSREQNTLAAWMKHAEGGGHVRHYLIDFGDCFGSIWEPPMLGRRIGHANYLDFGYVAEDFVTFGVLKRPWDTARFGPTGATFGYYNGEQFVADEWRPGYPNPAFSRMQEGDAAWAARIIARFSDEHIRAMVAQAELPELLQVERLTAAMIERRDKILRRYLARVSPLTQPRVSAGRLCLDDLAVQSGVFSEEQRRYSAHYFSTSGREELSVFADGTGRVCTATPELSEAGEYGVLDVWSYQGEQASYPLRLHLAAGYAAPATPQVLGIERPTSHAPFRL